MTISYVLLEEMFLVQLFSKPQHTVASSTNREPSEKRKLSDPSKERRMLDAVIKPIAPQRRFVTASLNRNNASGTAAGRQRQHHSDSEEKAYDFFND